MDYSVLFTPFKIGSMRVKNRLVLSPMGHDCSTADGVKSTWEVDYYEARAKGGAGMIITGCIPLTKELGQTSREGYLDNYYVLPRLNELTDAVHRWDCRIAAQLSCGTGRNDRPDDAAYGNVPISASAVPSSWDPNVICRALTVEEIHGIMDSFTTAATICKKAGFDAIEVHAHAGYLVDQFMSPVWNKRTDEYGGTPENRARFAVDIIHAIRKAVGPHFPILFRISLDHRFNGGRTIDDSMVLLQELEKAGVDALDVDAGCYETLDYIFPPSYLGESCMSYVCAPARKAVHVPLLNGGTHNPETAVALIESGNADFVLMGRALIADPELPNKLMEGRREDVRPCLRCNESCIGSIWNRQSKTSCSVNPQVCAEARMQIVKTDHPKKVAVIGGGPAGMEAARVATLAGHRVTLFERSDKLGGVMGDICTSSWKGNIAKLLEYYKVQLKKLGVRVVLNHEVTADDPELASYDKLLVGCGSKPFNPAVPGIDGPNVVTMLDVHRDSSRVKGKRIVICGGGESGCDGALELAKDLGYEDVTVVEMMDDYARDAMFINKISLSTQLKEYGVKILCGARVAEIRPDAVVVETKDGIRELPADTVISAFGMKPDLTLVDAIDAKYHTKTRLIGDSFQLGKIGNAVRTGFYAGISI